MVKIGDTVRDLQTGIKATVKDVEVDNLGRGVYILDNKLRIIYSTMNDKDRWVVISESVDFGG